jgi:hypothetical protein
VKENRRLMIECNLFNYTFESEMAQRPRLSAFVVVA